MFDFTSYGFDISLRNTVTILIVGGCIRVPMEDNWKKIIQHAIAGTLPNVEISFPWYGIAVWNFTNIHRNIYSESCQIPLY